MNLISIIDFSICENADASIIYEGWNMDLEDDIQKRKDEK